jgi:allantoin racemase
MKQKIRLIAPLVTEGLRLDEYVADLSDGQVEVSAVILETGPASVEGSFDEALAVPGVVNRVIEAEQEGCAAAIIDCMSDPGLEAARETDTDRKYNRDVRYRGVVRGQRHSEAVGRF